MDAATGAITVCWCGQREIPVATRETGGRNIAPLSCDVQFPVLSSSPGGSHYSLSVCSAGWVSGGLAVSGPGVEQLQIIYLR